MGTTVLEKLICRVIWFTMSSFSLFFSVITPVIIYKMRSWNGTLLLVVSLSLTLGLYSFGLLLTTVYESDMVCQAQGIIIFFGGLSSALWTTCFSTTLLLLVTGVKFGGINQIYNYYVAMAVGLPLIITCVGIGMKFVTRGYLSCFVGVRNGIDFNGVYNIVIFICVVYNLFFFIYCWNRIRQMGGAKSPTAKALKEACFRMIYYPVVQSFCWFFIWARYFRSQATDEASPTDFTSLLLSCLSSPFFGTFMFAVFLIQQRKAKEVFLTLMLPHCVVSYIYQYHSETLLDRDSSTINSEGTGTGANNGSRNNSKEANSGMQTGGGGPAATGGADPLDINSPPRPSELYDGAVHQISRDDDEEDEEEGDFIGEESMYSTNQSISMVSRPSSLAAIRDSSDVSRLTGGGGFNTNNNSISGPIGSRTVSDVPIRSPLQQTSLHSLPVSPLKSSMRTTQSVRIDSTRDLHNTTQPVPITGAQRTQSVNMTTNSLFGSNNNNSHHLMSPPQLGIRQNSIRSPISSVFLNHMLSAQTSPSSQGNEKTLHRDRVKTVSSSATKQNVFSLLDESELFRIIQGQQEDSSVMSGGEEMTVRKSEINSEGAGRSGDVENNV